MNLEKIEATVSEINIDLDVLVQRGNKPAIMFLHGFGSTKEEYADIVHLPEFSNRTIVVYDAPGCGRSRCADHSSVTIDFLQETAEQVINHYGLGPYHLVGHSMGGLTALRLASSHSDQILSFINLEGNLAPEDCFFSRQILEKPAGDGESFLKEFTEKLRTSDTISNAFYAANLPVKINPDVIAPIFRSIVELSDNEDLLGQFIKIPIPKMFFYGDANQGLSYLPKLLKAGVCLKEIPHSAHFPMYSNPQFLWQAIGEFIVKTESKTNDC